MIKTGFCKLIDAKLYHFVRPTPPIRCFDHINMDAKRAPSLTLALLSFHLSYADDIVTRKEAERRIEQAEERRRYQEQLDEAKRRTGMP